MSHQQPLSWVEDVFQLLFGVEQTDHGKPNCNKTYVMYHGTTRTNATAIQRDGFVQSAGGMLGRGVYLSRDLNKARRYPIDPSLPDSERVVLRVEVNVGNVIAINYQGHPRQKNWHKGGWLGNREVFDTAWCPPNCGMTPGGTEEDCVWDPSRIKIQNYRHCNQKMFLKKKISRCRSRPRDSAQQQAKLLDSQAKL
uniref:PARP catalytic domain-containing protein n=1 Tax=Gadus morhua TaxID=8049 RepID=A0A8C4ZV11_GADMO